MFISSNRSVAVCSQGRLILAGTAVEGDSRVFPNNVSVLAVRRHILCLFSFLWHTSHFVGWKSVFKRDEKTQEEETKRESRSE